jgi:hypothetical protein
VKENEETMEKFEPVDLGDKVKHPKFGTGTVVVRIGEGENSKAIVKFTGGVGEKKLVLKYAKLKKIIERPPLPPAEGGDAPVGEAAPAEPAPAAEGKK